MVKGPVSWLIAQTQKNESIVNGIGYGNETGFFSGIVQSISSVTDSRYFLLAMILLGVGLIYLAVQRPREFFDYSSKIFIGIFMVLFKIIAGIGILIWKMISAIVGIFSKK